MTKNNDNYKALEHDMADAAILNAAEVCEGAAETDTMITEGIIGTYQKIENGVVGAYKKVETGAVNAYRAVEDFCVDKLFRKEGETLEEARERLQGKQ